MNMERFFDLIRDKVNITTENVPGIERMIEYGANHGSKLNDLAYILATAYWETAGTVKPVREAYWLSESWRRKNLRYWPYYGRGLVQTTWKENYLNLGDLLGVGSLFADNPDLLLEWEWALPAMFTALDDGLYTGKSLSDYIDDIDESDEEDYREYKNARRTVNGTDRDDKIARLALEFEAGLRGAGYRAGSTVTPSLPPTTTGGGKLSLWRILGRLLASIFRRK